MEQREKFNYKIAVFKKALLGFQEALQIESDGFSDVLKDLVVNGRIQKFDYCTELSWKLIQKYLNVIHKIDAKSAGMTLKELYLLKMITEDEYEQFLNMIDDRNRMNHEYKSDYLEKIHSRLNQYLDLMKRVLFLIENDINKI
jgi:nucleotidyltransferase substrate binding protein (TIGR01987 family)